MKRIPLTQGKFAIVSDADYAFLSQWKWCLHRTKGKEYACRNSPRPNRRTITMHRVVLERKLGHSRFDLVDHRDTNGLNNQRRNLRSATTSQNHQNRVKSGGRSQFKGVRQQVKGGRWQARIKVNGTDIHLGQFDTARAAARAYNRAAQRHFGKFARLNPV